MKEKILKKYFDSPSESSCIIFNESSKNLNFISKLCEKIECNKAFEEDLVKYIINILNTKTFKMNPYDIRFFVKTCNNDLGKITNELYKLM